MWTRKKLPSFKTKSPDRHGSHTVRHLSPTTLNSWFGKSFFGRSEKPLEEKFVLSHVNGCTYYYYCQPKRAKWIWRKKGKIYRRTYVCWLGSFTLSVKCNFFHRQTMPIYLITHTCTLFESNHILNYTLWLETQNWKRMIISIFPFSISSIYHLIPGSFCFSRSSSSSLATANVMIIVPS